MDNVSNARCSLRTVILVLLGIDVVVQGLLSIARFVADQPSTCGNSGLYSLALFWIISNASGGRP